MMYYERQRELADHFHPNVLEHLPEEIAQRVDRPSNWLEAFLDQRVPASWVQPLLEGAVAASPKSGSAVCCATPAHGCAPRPPPGCGAFTGGFGRAEHWEGYSGTLWSNPAMRHCYRNCFGADRMVARAWVLQQARASSTQRPPGDVPPPWEEGELPLAEGIVHLGDLSPWRSLELLKTAITAMTIEDRRDLILAIPAHADRRFFGNRVGTDPDLYRALLERNVPVTAHLEPLCGEPSERMIRMAREHACPFAVMMT